MKNSITNEVSIVSSNINVANLGDITLTTTKDFLNQITPKAISKNNIIEINCEKINSTTDYVFDSTYAIDNESMIGRTVNYVGSLID